MAAARVERRLAAVLAADVVGYSRLMERDEARHARAPQGPPPGAHRAAHRRAPAAASSSSWATAPSASSPARSTRSPARSRSSAAWPSGRRTSPEAERIRFRIGINLGDVFTRTATSSATASTSRRGWRRWPSRAGSALAQRARADSATARSRFAPMGRHRVKNIAEPVEVWRVVLERAKRPGPPPGTQGRRVAWPGPRPRCCCSSRREGWWWVSTPSGPDDDAPAPVDRRAAVRQHDRRPGAGVLRRRHHRGPDHRALHASPAASSSPATRPSPTRAGPSTSRRSGASSAWATCSRAASAGRAMRCGSTRSWSMPRLGSVSS